MKKRRYEHKRLGEKLVEAGKISPAQLAELLEVQRNNGGYLGRMAVEGGYIRDEELQEYLPKEVAAARALCIRERQVLNATEFYRLQTALKFTLFSDDPIKTLLVTSAVPGEGKTSCANYFAQVLATVQEGRFLLVDADLGHPTLHNRHDVPSDPGWTNYLVNGHTLDECLAPTDVPNLQLLPAGAIPPNPAALFASRRMEEFTKELRQRFDLVVFDSSPLLASSASAILSTNLDAAILVVRAGTTKRQAVKKAVGLLNESKTKILGVILNQVIDHDFGKYMYQYSGYGNGSK